MNVERLPVGVLIPTLQARPRLSRWLPDLQAVLALAQEAVVVDSYSQDGTLEFLRAHLRHPRLRFLTHPPGLYESWNFGLKQLAAPYTYIATVGDTLAPAGLRHLFSVAMDLHSDVVISRPEFYTLDGQRVRGKTWPIHRLLEWRPLNRPAVVDPSHALLLSLLDAPEGLLGSSASNLYSTAILQRLPFPVEYGHAGDVAWVIRHAFDIMLAATPEICSRFTIDPEAGRTSEDERQALIDRLFGLARQAVSERGAAEDAPLASALEELASEFIGLRQAQGHYDRARRRTWPWILSPTAWQARLRRNHHRRLLRSRHQQIRRQFGLLEKTTPRPVDHDMSAYAVRTG